MGADVMLMLVGTIGAMANGSCMPIMTILVEEMSDCFGTNQNNTHIILNVVSKLGKDIVRHLVRPYKVPYAVIFRETAIVGIEGFSKLPKHCLAMCCGFFVTALVVNLLKDVIPKKISQFIPIPMAMAVLFYIRAYFAIDIFVGTVLLFLWERLNRKDAEDYAGAVASGLICGDGIWTIPSSILSIFKKK
ncbi:YELLOW STRIPE like 6 [Prunus dulcis]|uniref:YELLOW STRIPE like 6 n=1 Tax=Prunus dulcis TaxID=3755 RepID=A0A4Y1R740_PRUDU|nr:YELLOW STRIPE like 6 [Prunus dulcis]